MKSSALVIHDGRHFHASLDGIRGRVAACCLHADSQTQISAICLTRTGLITCQDLCHLPLKTDKALLARLSLKDDCFNGGALERADLSKSRRRKTTQHKPARFLIKEPVFAPAVPSDSCTPSSSPSPSPNHPGAACPLRAEFLQRPLSGQDRCFWCIAQQFLCVFMGQIAMPTAARSVSITQERLGSTVWQSPHCQPRIWNSD